MAGTVPTITPGSLVIERGLKDKPIYFVKVNGQSIVIKGDAPMVRGMTGDEAGLSIKWTSKLMKNVNNKLVNTKIMTPVEVNLFKPAVLLKFNPGTEQRSFVEQGAPNYIWVKMPIVPGLSDANFFGEGRFAKPIPSKVKKTILKFYDESIWPPLGKILAVDIFNGNGDRFDTEDGTWVNYGNVMFLEGGDTSVIGLDTFDPNAQSANLNAPPVQGSLNPLLALTDPVRRLNFAKACTESVGFKLSKNLLGCESVTYSIDGLNGDKVIWTLTKAEIEKLYVSYAPLLVAGIQKGADQLKLYLQTKVREYRQLDVLRARPLPGPGQQIPQQRVRGGLQLVQPNLKPRDIPQGVWDRMVFLGWQV